VRSILIFLHIPKTAGSTLHGIIERQYPSGVLYTPDGVDHVGEARRLRELAESEFSRIRVVKGHMGFFGWHECLQAPTSYVTLLRDPVERIISHYYYVLRSPSHPTYERVTSERLSLAEYVETRLTFETSNLQTRILSGTTSRREALDRGHLGRARTNLARHFALAGLTERFDETVMLLRREFGWSMPFYRRRRVTRRRPTREQVGRETVECIAAHNALDSELYEYATELFEERVRLAGTALEREVSAFRRVNAPIDAVSSLIYTAYELATLRNGRRGRPI